MNYQHEIDKIILSRYCNYAPSKFRRLQRIHRRIQFIEIKPTKWQQFKSKALSRPLPQKTVIDNSKGFLEYLQKLEHQLPIERFTVDKEMKLLYFKNIKLK